MSGFVGIVSLDGTPIDRALLKQMTSFLEFRGPDAKGIWCDGTVGLGHTLLRTTREVVLEKQPFGLDGRLWIISDARIDARAELIKKLQAAGGAASSLSLSTTDCELILHAYDAWGEACVEHLLGDFSFAIWDARERRLFCARDPFGVKPFFYANFDSCVIFSNTLDCIREHPLVSNRLNDLAIADFLMFDMNQDPSTTSFTDIQRLPPAHLMKHERESLTIRRYWELSVTTPIHFRREEEYVERFRELLDLSVADRLRTKSAGVLMSGGLDSTLVAASAKCVIAGYGDGAELRAYTEVFDSLIPHEERYYATLVAKALNIPSEYLASDHWKIFDRAEEQYCQTPEPIHSAYPDIARELLRKISAHAGVAMTGYGGDPALCGRLSLHFRQLFKRKRFSSVFFDIVRFLSAEGRFSRLYISTRWRLLLGSKKESPSYPPWLNEDLEKQLGLRDRWQTMSNNVTSIPASTVRPEAHEHIANRLWPILFEIHDAGHTRIPVDVCHPIFDLRLMNFLLGLPRFPWCTDKEIFREAARGRLPDAVRLRRKSPLAADPLVALLKRPEAAWVDRVELVPQVEQYVVRSRIPTVYRERDPWLAWVHLRPLSFSFWLRGEVR